MSSQAIRRAIQQKTGNTSFFTHVEETVERAVASFMLLFHRRDCYNSGHIIVFLLISIEYLTMIALCFSPTIIQDWRLSPETLQVAKLVQLFDVKVSLIPRLSYEQYLVLVGIGLAAFLIFLIFAFQITRITEKSGFCFAFLRSLMRISAPLILITFQSTYLRILFTLVT